jgi:tetratricopeptide (TPR) repeat protein
LDEQAGQTADAEAEPIEREARVHWGLAGEAYRELAKLHYVTREYPEFIWEAAQALLAARDYPAAAQQYREYMSLESRNRRPLALLGLGQSLVARGETQEALAILQECIDLDPTSVASFQARLLAAEAHLEQGETSRAEACLHDNLDSDFLTPASQEWRESLFALGRLLFEAGRYNEAVSRLEEAVARYPRDPQSLDARYMLALSYWKTALVAESTQGGVTEAERDRRLRDALDDALSYYDQVLEAFEHRGTDSPLPPWQRGMLRNSYFGRGAVLFKLGRFEPAIHAYLAIINRYQGSPEVLEAYVEIFNCYRRLHRTDEARSALQLARVALDHLPEKAAFDAATNYSRQEWADYLESLATL